MVRLHLHLLAALAISPASLGCASVLGDFELAGNDIAAGSGSGSGGASAEDSCSPGSTAEIQDDFSSSSVDAERWEAYSEDEAHVSVDQAEQALRITTDGSAGVFGGYRSKDTYSLKECYLAVEVKESQREHWEVAVRMELIKPNRDDATKLDRLRISQVGPEMYFHDYIAEEVQKETHIPYDPDEHRWWRLSERGGETEFETSPDGRSWTSQLTVDTHKFESDAQVHLTMGSKEDLTMDQSLPASVIFDNLNVLPR